MLSGQTGHVDLGGASAGAILQPDGGDSVPSGWPLPGQLTSGFGWRQFLGRTQFHTGVDLAVGEATPVLAPASGTVLQAGSFPGYGNAVLILHGAGFASLVAHLSGFTVEIGDWVRRGQVVGHSGNTGNSTGPHLHYEVWLDGRVVDPGPYLSGAQ
jgi:murein DD-endopeptidase MepM/ murein hydrolase activator NlpD